MWRWIGRFDSRTSLRSKLLVAFALLVLVPTVAIGFFSYRKSSSIIQEQTSRAYLEALRQTSINLSYRMTEVENISYIVYTNDKLQQMLRRARASELTTGQVMDDYKDIKEILHNLETSRNIFRIRLLVPSTALYTTENISLFGLSDSEFDGYRRELGEAKNMMAWKYLGPTSYLDAGTKSIISLQRLMKDFNNVTTSLGVIAIDVEERTFTDVLQNMNLALPYKAMLIKDQSVIASYAHEPERLGIDKAPLSDILRLGGGTDREARTIQYDGKTYLYLVQQLDNVDWKIVALIPTVNIADQSDMLGVYILLLSIGLIALATALAFLLSGRITRRLSVLADKMKGIEHGHFGETVKIEGRDEISLLQRRFNKMSGQIENLIGEVYRVTQHKQQEEMKVLEGRINSHFLYNTLDSVKWMALKSSAPDIARVVTDLSKFFRIGLNRGKDKIPFEKEIEHVRAYVDIQNVRFGGALRTEFSFDPRLQHIEIIKLILQPVVENAIIHGINKAGGRDGLILLRGRLVDDEIVLLVADNGAGMDRETAAGVLDGTVGGYGLSNVHRRLQLYYGPACGVSIRSKPGAGTVVRLKLKTAPVDPLRNGVRSATYS
ncbi:cache domain-containing sensor histidine kinase [Cohnella hashimotonis]|uniref:histidine kinase n=1 Tax=Cohnella hashimotonis TaxID=2826895 RepID=A0ABT6TQZ8_9BACL|nr:sensor histidine kinase [Cohnella hashimotonis]MDI4649281.1 sensor histidine kinase [Cohnella hashimotonis]